MRNALCQRINHSKVKQIKMDIIYKCQVTQKYVICYERNGILQI